MARRKRRSVMRTRKAGKTFWFRPPSFFMPTVEVANGVISDVILTESDFMDPVDGLNDTKKGAPILERIVCDIGFSQLVGSDYFNPAGFGQTTMHVEVMLWSQTGQFTSLVSSSTTFDTVLEKQRILGYQVMDFQGARAPIINSRQSIAVHAVFEPKTKVALREKSLGVAIRTNFDLGDSEVISNFNYVQATMLITVP